MSDPQDPVMERVLDGLKRLQLLHPREILCALLSEAAKAEWTYLDFLDQILRREADGNKEVDHRVTARGRGPGERLECGSTREEPLESRVGR